MTSSNNDPVKPEKSPRVFKPDTQKKRQEALKNKRNRIMSAALMLFSKHGVNGTTVEQIAEAGQVSKSNLLYYFASKEQLYIEVIQHLLDVWLSPLKSFEAHQDPIETLSDYIKVKLTLSRDHPAESKLFCMEVVQGAPLLLNELESPLCELVDAKVKVINSWIEQGKLLPVDPYHLIFSIWAITQHYADFNVQIKAVTGNDLNQPEFFNRTLASVKQIILGGITPQQQG